MLKNKYTVLLALILLQTASLYAVKPRFSTHQSKGKLERGQLHNVSILDKGIITLSPQTRKVLATGDPFIWSVVSDSKGNLYLGTGNDGIIYQYTTNGDSTVWFDSDELEIYAMAVDKNDNIYAGTSPNGKVYKITPNGESSVFFNPQDTYIWDLAMTDDGTLYVATGEGAAIYKVDPTGKGLLFFEGDQTHIRSLFIKNGVIYAGSSGNGYVYKIDANGKGFVLLDTQMQEVHDLIVTGNGNIYAAAYGESTTPMAAQKRGQGDSDKEGTSEEGEDEEGSFAQSFLIENMPQAIKTPTALYRITSNGHARDFWIGSDERVQTLLEDPQGGIWVGTGNKGKLYHLDDRGKSSLMLTLDETQITSLIYDAKKNLVASTSNLGTTYQVRQEHVKSATYESEVIDTGLQSLWGALSWEGDENKGSLTFYTRSGNTEIPEQTWSDWRPLSQKNGNLQIASPAARFVQWKCELTGVSGNGAPELHKVTIAYMQKNLPPTISDIIIHRPGDKFDLNMSDTQKEKGVPYPQQPSKESDKTGYRSIDWLFEDPNFDGLVFDLYYQKKGSSHWAPLVTDYANNFYSWDSRQMSDGEYQVKVVASDNRSNTPGSTETGELISDTFTIDNTGPQIKTGKTSAGQLSVTISDQWSPISNVWYSINAKDWTRLDPDDLINDSKTETYNIPLTSGPQEIAIRAEDNVGNSSVIYKQQ